MRRKTYGIRHLHLCHIIAEEADASGWCNATVIVSRLRSVIRPECATRLYLHWGDHSKKEARRLKPADVQWADGCRYVVFRCLSVCKQSGLLESQRLHGNLGQWRLTKAGRALLKKEKKRGDYYGDD